YSRRPHPPSVTKVTPYTVVLQAIVYKPGEDPSPKWQETHAVRSDGALVRREEGVRPSGAYIYRDLYLPTGQHISTDDIAELKNTGTLKTTLRYLRDPATSCLSTLDGEPMAAGEKLLNQTTRNNHRVQQISQKLSTDLYALDLGCALVY